MLDFVVVVVVVVVDSVVVVVIVVDSVVVDTVVDEVDVDGVVLFLSIRRNCTDKIHNRDKRKVLNRECNLSLKFAGENRIDHKETCLKEIKIIFVNSFSLSSSLFLGGKRKREKITSYSTFSNLIDFLKFA